MTRWITAATLVLSAAAHGQDRAIPRVSEAPTIDGRIDEGVWDEALVVDLIYETRPGENTPAPVRTEARLMEDGVSLYVSFRAEDPDPSQIRAFLRDRDASFRDDFVGVVLDTFNDERRAFEFFVNPLGAQMDLIQNEVTGNEDSSWDAIWDSAGQITDFGYEVEIEIPFRALRFAATGEPQTWGIDILRFYPRDSRYRLAASIQDRNRNCYLCQLDKYTGMSDARPGRNLELTPTLTASRTDERDAVDDPLIDGDVNTELGLDISWGITPNFNFNGTINPDFSQVEADVAQLDVNTTFALFFPEKRPFFLEGADYFETDQRLVYTRTMVAPDYGVRLTGKQDANAVGGFVVQDSITNFLIPGVFGSSFVGLDQESTNASFRYRRDLGTTSTLGVISTARQGDDYHNYTLGVDGRFQPSEDHTFRFLVVGSDTEYPDAVVEDEDQPIGSFTGHLARAQYNYSTRDNFAYVSYDDRDENFRADLGFIGQVGTDKAVVGGGHNWYGEDHDWWDQVQLSGDWDITHDFEGRLIERELEGEVWLRGPMQSFLEVGGFVRDRLWDDILFDEDFVYFFGEFQPVGGLKLALFTGTGNRIDFANSKLGDFVEFSPRMDWNFGRHFQTNIRHTYQTLKRDGGSVFEANLSDIRFSWQFSLRQRLRLTVQYANVKRDPFLYDDEVTERYEDVGTQLIYSYKLNPRTVFFAGYSDFAFDNDDVDSLRLQNRTLFMKIGYAWQPL